MYEQLSLFTHTVDIDGLIDAMLHIGSHFAYGKARVYDQIMKGETLEQDAAFLRREYGIGGSTWEYGGRGMWIDYDGRGIRCYTWDEPKINIKLNWMQAAKRIKEAVASGEYITQAQYNALRKEEADWKEYWKKEGVS